MQGYRLGRVGQAALLCMLLSVHTVWGQETPQPVPYTPDEFSPALAQIRRSEIIAFGSFPFSYFLLTTVYDLVRFSVRSISAGQFDSLYAPLFFAPQNKPEFTDDEQLGLLLGSVALSLVIVGIDLVLAAIETAEASATNSAGSR